MDKNKLYSWIEDVEKIGQMISAVRPTGEHNRDLHDLVNNSTFSATLPIAGDDLGMSNVRFGSDAAKEGNLKTLIYRTCDRVIYWGTKQKDLKVDPYDADATRK